MDFKEFLKSMETMDLQTNETANGRITIKQMQRNAIRRQLMDKFYDYLKEQDFDVFMTNDGIILNVENEIIGDVNIEIKLSLKGLDYDLDVETEKYEITEADKKARKSKTK
jgi:hypothetical protein